MNQRATEVNRKYRVVLNLERVGLFFTTTILEKHDNKGGNIGVSALDDTDIIQQRSALPPRQNMSVIRGYKTRQCTKHLLPSRQYCRWWTIECRRSNAPAASR